jgi:D-glycero-D-manno-heptose 1,7-bisphosphate phosphatase
MTLFPRLLLLDRDGVLNEDRPDSVRHRDALVLIPKAVAAVAAYSRLGRKVALVTNQGILGRGHVSKAEFGAIQATLIRAVEAAGGRLASVHIAPDARDGLSDRRKPGPGMLREAMRQHGVSPAETLFIGDALTDAEAAQAAGVAFRLVLTGKGRASASARPDLAAFATLAEALADLGACG